MKKNKLKRLQYVALGCSFVGYSTYTIVLLLTDKLNDFLKGFLHGLSFVMICTWCVFMVWSAFNKRNPYKLIK